ncbi:MAG: hypothetical protein LBE89_04195 [Helicobacteraceae bacterium]|nr:hypothetical protein [Helicobacteraceae bacterium]
MDLKDMVLSALADIEAQKVEKIDDLVPEIYEGQLESVPPRALLMEEDGQQPALCSETEFLNDMHERTLVLFEGLQSPNNKAIEAKVDLILNFLEYLLSLIEQRLEAQKNT